jgi:hypothetical protein
MPKFAYVILADEASTPVDGKFSITGGGIQGIGVLSIPAQHAHFAIVVGIRLEPGYRGKFEIEGNLEYPSGYVPEGESPKMKGEFEVEAQPGMARTITISIDIVGLILPVTGVYVFRFTMDGDAIETPFEVTIQAKPADPALVINLPPAEA